MMARTLAIVISLLAAVASAVAVVHTHHQRRTLVVALEKMEERRDRLRIEWAMLHLEHSTWAAGERIEKIATDTLDLHRPSAAATRQVTIEERDFAPGISPALESSRSASFKRTGHALEFDPEPAALESRR